MIFCLIIISIIIEKKNEIYILINIECLVYKTISFRFVRRTDFECIDILIRKLIGIGGKEDRINKIIKVNININRHQQDVFFYIIRDHLGYDLILGKLWMIHHNIKITPKANIFFIHSSETKIRINEEGKKRSLNLLEIGVMVF